MLTSNERRIILKCAKKYRVSSVLLFGSSLEKINTMTLILVQRN